MVRLQEQGEQSSQVSSYLLLPPTLSSSSSFFFFFFLLLLFYSKHIKPKEVVTCRQQAYWFFTSLFYLGSLKPWQVGDSHETPCKCSTEFCGKDGFHPNVEFHVNVAQNQYSHTKKKKKKKKKKAKKSWAWIPPLCLSTDVAQTFDSIIELCVLVWFLVQQNSILMQHTNVGSIQNVGQASLVEVC